MCCVADEAEPAIAIVPLLRDPVTDISFVDLRVVWNPCKGGAHWLSEMLRFFFDQGKALNLTKLVTGFAVPGHCKVEDPSLRVLGAIWHAGNGLEGMQ